MNVSVLIPVHNRGEYIRSAVESALSEGASVSEVVVVDDGSTDDTVVRLGEIHDTRVQCIQQAHAGVSAARNRAMASATGDWILWLDSDDRLLAGALQAYGRTVVADPSVVALYGDWEIIDSSGKVTGFRRFQTYSRQSLVSALVHGCVIPFGGCMMRRQAALAVGGFDTDLPTAEDYDFLSRFAQSCIPVHVGQTTYQYREHRRQLCGPANHGDRKNERIVVLHMVERYGFPLLFPDLYEERREDSATNGAAWFRLAGILMERDGETDADECFLKGIQQATVGSSATTRLEAMKVLWLAGRRRAIPARRWARRCLRLWPTEPRVWLTWLWPAATKSAGLSDSERGTLLS